MLSISRKHVKNEAEKQPRFTIPYYRFASTTRSALHLIAIYLLTYEINIILSKKFIYFIIAIDNDNDFHYHLMYMSS